MARVSRRISSITESATLAIDARAKALKATGHDVIGFGAGEPDFPTPDHIVEAAVEACRRPSSHHYGPTAGLPALREAIAAKTARDSGFVVDASQVVVTNGAKQAVYEACATLLDPGDEVLITAPYWVTYPEAVTLAGGVPVPVPTDERGNFIATVEQLEAARTPLTKLVVHVSPSNPTGAVHSRHETEAVGRWATECGLWALTDEIYEHLVYGGAEASSLPVLVPELAERCVVLNGVSKSYAMTGWRVGWMIGPPDVVAAAANLQSHLTSNVAHVAQSAALAAVSGDLEAATMMRGAFDRRRRRMHQVLTEIPGVTCAEPLGAFYAFPSFAGVLGKEVRGRRLGTTLELAEVALEEAGVAFVPGEAFGAPGYGRFSYALADDDLTEGITRFAKLLAEAEG